MELTTTAPVPLSQYLATRGWTHAKLAAKTGCHQPKISAIASGRRNPQRKTRQAIAHALGITTDELCDMLTASATLAQHSDQRQLCRAVAEMSRLAKRCNQPAPVTIAVARAGRRALSNLIRQSGKVTIVVSRRQSA